MRVGIAGAGLFGRLLAWRLLNLGHEVCLFDCDSRTGKQSAAYAAAAMLSAWSEMPESPEAIYAMGENAVEGWRSLLKILRETSGMDVELRENGSLILAHPSDFAEIDHFEQLIKHKLGKGQTQDETNPVLRVNAEEIASLEPDLAGQFKDGLYLSREGLLDNRALLKALAVAIDKGGGTWREQRAVTEVRPGAIVCETETINCDLAIDCRGIGACGQNLQLRAVRGEIIRLHAPEVQITRAIRLLHPRFPIYIAPRAGQKYVIGATEIESDDQGAPTVRSTLELLSTLYSVHPGFAEARILEMTARSRAAYPDNLPRIEHTSGLLTINGLYRHGYLLAPHLLEELLASIKKQQAVTRVTTRLTNHAVTGERRQ